MIRTAALPAALVLLLAGTLAIAQQPQPPSTDAPPAAAMPTHAANPQKQTARLAKELNLTPDQTAKLEPVLADRDQKIAAIRANTSLAPADAKKQLHSVQKSTRDQLSTILTPAQIEQLRTIQRSRGKGQAASAPTA